MPGSERPDPGLDLSILSAVPQATLYRSRTGQSMDISAIIPQIKFAGSMSPRQWAILEALSAFSLPLSASEWIDPEMTALIRNGLAVFDPSGDSGSSIRWTASDAG